MKRKINIVFMGTASFAVSSLEILLKSGYEISAVITAPDKPAGRGRKIRFSPVKEFALEKNLKILQPENLKNEDFINEIVKLKPDIQVVVAFRMLPKILWQIPHLGTFNLHSSLLPQYRGAAPINHAIINGEIETGVTTFLIDKKIDAGKILFQDKTEIRPTESAGELHDRLMETGAKLVLKTTEALISETFETKEQDNYFAQEEDLKPAPKIFKEHCRINWNNPVENVYNLIRGLNPIPTAYCTLKLKNDKILNLKIYSSQISSFNIAGNPGNFEGDGKNSFVVKCTNGSLALTEVQLEGKKRMNITDFLRGFNFAEIKQVL